MSTSTVEELELQLNELMQIKVFDERVAEGVRRILDAMPAPEEERDAERKVRLLLLRCKTRLLLPTVSKDAEKDYNTALKLRQGSADTWVELAECLLRRNAFKEACEALDNALRIDPTNVAALCKYSQVQRNRCGEAGHTATQKRDFMADAVAKARAAVNADVDDADAWNTLALSLLSQLTAEGMTFEGVRRALAAMQQAERKTAGGDPDLYFNKAVLEGLMGHFGDAAADFLRAHELDSRRLKGTRRLCESNTGVLRRAITRTRNVVSVGKKEFKKLGDGLVAASKTLPAGATHLVVVDILSEATMQPLTLLTANASGVFHLVLLFEVSNTAFKIGDIVSLPASEAAVSVTHDVPAIPFLDTDAFSVTFAQFHGDHRRVLLNGRPLPTSSRVPLQMSSRLFA